MTASDNSASVLAEENQRLRDALSQINALVSNWEGSQGGAGKGGAAFFAALERTPTAQDFRTILDSAGVQKSVQER